MHFDGDQKIEDVKSEKDDSFDIPSSSLPKSNAQEKEALSKVRHYYIPVQEKGQWKFDTFCDLHNVVSMSKTIIFVNNTKHSWIDALGKQLKEKGFSAYVAKGRALNQCKKYQQFVKNSRNTISNDCLVTTDQMYKGGSKLGCFPLVVNYDMPSSKQKYYKEPFDWSEKYGVEPNEDFLLDGAKALDEYKTKFRRQLRDFDRQIWRYYEVNVQNTETLKWKNEIADKLLEQFRQSYLQSQIQIFGSTINQCGRNDSDLDVCILLPCHVLRYKTDRDYAEAVLTNFKKEALTNSSNFSLMPAGNRVTARLPMLKLWWKGKIYWWGNPSYQLEVSVVVNNVHSIHTSQLLRYYSRLDDRFPALCMLVKSWAKKQGIADGFQGTLNGISLVLMVLHFMQVGTNPPILPNLQRLYPDFFSSDAPLERFDRNLELPSRLADAPGNSHTIGELLIDFFYYYAGFPFDSKAISVAKGRLCYRESNNYIYIEEPFSKENTAKCVSNWLKFRDITEAFEKASNLFLREEKHQPFDWSEKYGVEPNEDFLLDGAKALDEYKTKFRRQLRDFDRQIWRYYEVNVQNTETLKWKNEIADKLLEQFRQSYLQSQIQIFGSTINQCGRNDSDLDVCILLPCHVLRYKTDRDYAEAVLTNFKKEALTNSSNFSLMPAGNRVTARLPMLKLWWKGKIYCIHTSQLLRYYSRLDDRFPALCMLVKSWAKKQGIADGFQGTLNGISLVLMVLHFMQVGTNPPILPNLQRLYPDFFSSDAPLERFDRNLELPSRLADAPGNSHTIGELLIDFFYYYAGFPFDSKAISVAKGRLCYRESNNYIYIEEPFSKENTAKCVSNWLKFRDITEAFEKASNLFLREEKTPSLAILGL
uniref:PAP-associated domain-containing protein n=1 Tax=Ditylenchus dipsaci TaxID=166011 RepID=A0A915EUG0_9BILA